MNVTSEFMYLNKNPEQTIFERLRPPILEKINMDTSGGHHLATVDVIHETDCAFKCYTIRECNAFVVTCKS
ncbi:hypothetical protein DPMN_036007 [Dreissena polymorpha]|uniref:Uncharacterized protein n=1 Tax=Dreissena polymorpha TaxID=45954 RepID=A0A9D4MBS4_DREPO|nr:hypothetical protein DPMN_036007 [Dreissena polymorpha]